MRLYRYTRHPHIAARLSQGPVTIRSQLSLEAKDETGNWYRRGNAWLAIKVTAFIGSMTCAYLFAVLAFLGLPTALKPGNIGFMFWLASDFFQLVLLSVIIVGQNIQSRAADTRAEQTYNDAEAILAEAVKIQDHLAAQDDVLVKLATSAAASPV